MGKQPAAMVFEYSAFYRIGADPAEIVATKLDSEECRNRLPARAREVFDLAIVGSTTKEIAHHLKCTPGAVSQQGRRILDTWLSMEAV